MLYSALLLSAAAFQAPLSLYSASPMARVNTGDIVMQRKGGFWERDDWKAASAAASAASAAAAPAPAAAPAAAVGGLTVAQACVFMEKAPTVSFADKKTFLLSKGVSEFVIAEAACTAPDTTLVL